jgi:hypothetical protein
MATLTHSLFTVTESLVCFHYLHSFKLLSYGSSPESGIDCPNKVKAFAPEAIHSLLTHSTECAIVL